MVDATTIPSNIFPGGGEMGGRMRTFDWSATRDWDVADLRLPRRAALVGHQGVEGDLLAGERACHEGQPGRVDLIADDLTQRTTDDLVHGPFEPGFVMPVCEAVNVVPVNEAD